MDGAKERLLQQLFITAKGMVLAPWMCGCLFEEEYERLIEQT